MTDTTTMPTPGAKTGATTGAVAAGAPPTLEQSSFGQSRSPSVDGVVRRMESGRQWARHQADHAQEHVRAHPLRTAAYALGAGVVAGMLMRSISRER